MPDYRAALTTRSSYVENVLPHSRISALAGELWRRDPEVRMDILRTEVDESGFDLVLQGQGEHGLSKSSRSTPIQLRITPLRKRAHFLG